MSLRVVPAATYSSNTRESKGAPSAPGIHDTLRTKLSLTADAFSTSDRSLSNGADVSTTLTSKHPLEARLTNWRATNDSLKMAMLRRTFGTAEPVRRGMELRIASVGEWRPSVLGGSAGVHSDILAGRDGEIGWDDVFAGNELRHVPDIHTEIEAQLKVN